MAYSDFKIASVKQKFQLIIDEESDLFSSAPLVPVSAWLTETLQETLALALAINTVVAVSIGGTVPLVLKRFNVDPAVASGPLLTTIRSMSGSRGTAI